MGIGDKGPDGPAEAKAACLQPTRTRKPPAHATVASSRYKRLALRVHPDKAISAYACSAAPLQVQRKLSSLKVRNSDPADAKAAFSRLDTAAKIVEAVSWYHSLKYDDSSHDSQALSEHDIEVCRELRRVLRALLGSSDTANS